MNWPLVTYYSSAALAPTIAAIAVYVTVLQWKLAKDRWRLDLYEKRYQTYKAVMEFISLMVRMATCSDEDRTNFIRAAKLHEFLFKPKIAAYIEELHNKSVKKFSLNRDIQRNQGDALRPIREKLSQEDLELALWFDAQSDKARALFEPYLRNHRH